MHPPSPGQDTLAVELLSSEAICRNSPGPPGRLSVSHPAWWVTWLPFSWSPVRVAKDWAGRPIATIGPYPDLDGFGGSSTWPKMGWSTIRKIHQSRSLDPRFWHLGIALTVWRVWTAFKTQLSQYLLVSIDVQVRIPTSFEHKLELFVPQSYRSPDPDADLHLTLVQIMSSYTRDLRHRPPRDCTKIKIWGTHNRAERFLFANFLVPTGWIHQTDWKTRKCFQCLCRHNHLTSAEEFLNREYVSI